MKYNIILILFFAQFALYGQNWQSSRVVVEQNGCLSYPEDNEKNRIPDFSYAGYKNGNEEIPDIEVKVTISAKNGDNTNQIQNAINQVAQLPLNANGFRGAVMLNAGEYEVLGEIKIDVSGVVLKGVGDGSNPSNSTIIKAKGNSPSNRDVITIGGGSETRWSGQVSGTKTNITSSFVQVGSFTFEVSDASKYSAGDNIIIYHPGSQSWVNALDGGGSNAGDWPDGSFNIIFNRFITDIQGNTITIDAPVYNHLDKSLTQSYIYKYNRSGIITNVGIQNIRIDIEHTGTAENHAKNALVFKQVENAWAKNCTFLHFIFSGVLVNTGSLITVENCKAMDPESKVETSRRYNFNLEEASNNILFKNCYANLGRHSYTSNGKTSVSGIVFLRCESEDPYTSSEGHRHWSMGMLYDNWKDHGNLPNDGGGRVFGLYNRGDWGTNHGWSNAHSVAWNCDLRRSAGNGKAVIQKPPTAQNYAIGGYGDFTGNGPKSGVAGHIEGIGQAGLNPGSLYEAQLNCRLNKTNTCTPVSSSSDDGNVAENVLDDNLNTRWSANGDGEWIEFCFGEDSVELKAIGIAFFKGDERASYFDILVSNDGQNWTNLLTNQSSSGQQLSIELFPFTSTYAKYLRYVGHGNSQNEWNSVTEIQIDSSKIVTKLATQKQDYAIKLYPNPSKDGHFTITGASQVKQITVTNLEGKNIEEYSLDENHFTIYQNGFFLVRLKLKNNEVLVRKVIVSHN